MFSATAGQEFRGGSDLIRVKIISVDCLTLKASPKAKFRTQAMPRHLFRQGTAINLSNPALFNSLFAHFYFTILRASTRW